MFFHLNEDALRQLRERAAAAQAKQAEQDAETDGPQFLLHPDGAIVLDDPSLVKVIAVSDEPSSKEALDNTFIWSSHGWISIRLHPVFSKTDNHEPPTPSDPAA